MLATESERQYFFYLVLKQVRFTFKIFNHPHSFQLEVYSLRQNLLLCIIIFDLETFN